MVSIAPICVPSGNRVMNTQHTILATADMPEKPSSTERLPFSFAGQHQVLFIHEGAGEQAILKRARQFSDSLLADGRRRILAGETSLEEVLRVTAIS